MAMDLTGLRREYESRGIDASDLDPDPLQQVRAWLDDADAAECIEPTAMTLSTVDTGGRPESRYVLLRGLDERGFAFYTNYQSAKARALADRPHAALTFGWLALHRSVRVEGGVERLAAAESDAYFASRPRAAQIGAWASPQSTVMAGRDALERAVAEAETRFADQEVPRPPHWGGFVVRHDRVEFWQGRAGRLHDRVRYERDGEGWRIERLAP
jgi:pyridoxamine 5'-phosphate oxidase